MPIPDVVAKAQDAMTVDRVYGKPVERDGVTIIPAAAIRGGGGGGGGTGTDTAGSEGEGEGGGYGISARPIGAFVIENGNVTWQPAIDATRIAIVANVVVAIVAFVIWRAIRHR